MLYVCIAYFSLWKFEVPHYFVFLYHHGLSLNIIYNTTLYTTVYFMLYWASDQNTAQRALSSHPKMANRKYDIKIMYNHMILGVNDLS